MSAEEKRGSNRNCSVFGCTNTARKAYSSGKRITFYAFPSKPWQSGRRRAWIRFTKRTNKDGTPWEPSKNGTICSEHFDGGQKSEHPNHPNFIPTIFDVDRPAVTSTDKLERFNRLIKRTIRIPSPSPDTDTGTPDVTSIDAPLSQCHVIQSTPSSTSDRSTQVRPELIDITVDSDILRRDSFRNPEFRGFESVKENEAALRDLTSVTRPVFDMLLSLLPACIPKKNVLSPENKLLLTLMKLKGGNGMPYSVLGVLFGLDDSVVSQTFNSVISKLYSATSSWIFFPSKAAILETMPEVFKENYPTCRVIIDCTEMKTETPANVNTKIHMYSNYKGCFTVKYLIGISPRGFISFLSRGYGGRATDSFITNDCGILDKIEPGDTIMADKGFPHVNVQDGVVVVMPPFSKGKELQFSAMEVDQTYHIARLRIHVERAIQRIKIYKILSTTIPMTMLPNIDKIVHICCVLANLSFPIIK